VQEHRECVCKLRMATLGPNREMKASVKRETIPGTKRDVYISDC
jgi:hypothetical protein